MKKKADKKAVAIPVCDKKTLLAIKDAMGALNGSWKLQILVSLGYSPKRFKQISKEVEGISDKMLSKELKDLEMNYLVTRTVIDTFPPTVEYAITDHTRTLSRVMSTLRDWGILHRKKIVGK